LTDIFLSSNFGQISISQQQRQVYLTIVDNNSWI
jgi:hypothetical protein